MDTFSTFTRLFTGAGRGTARTPVGEFATSYGAFTPKFYCNFRRPRTNQEAQKYVLSTSFAPQTLNSCRRSSLYNHIRTVAWYMDAAPFVSNVLPIPVSADAPCVVTPSTHILHISDWNRRDHICHPCLWVATAFFFFGVRPALTCLADRDLVGMVLSLYQVFLSWIFGVPYNILGIMVRNAVLSLFGES
jgi:hypothetical protein